tara:strand:- start:990 stop:3332 length:2343 start_codon:yes stop_codon:yes gene_type:complete
MANLRVDKITSTETFETTGSVQFVDADSLQIAANSDFDFGTGDFTVEWWQYMKDEPDEYQTVLSINYATNPNLAIQSASNAGVVAQKVYVNGSSVTFTEESNAPLSTWVHYALVRNGSGLNNLKIYRDGVQTGQGTYTGDIGSSSSINYIGGHPNVASGVDVQGFISNLRIVKGTALYTSNFKPSMRELEVVPGTALLACQSKTDASLEKTGKTITVNGTAVASELTPGILTPVPKAGGGSAITGSVEFSGSTDYLDLTNSTDFGLSSSDDFTLELWIHATSFDNSSSYSEVIRQGTSNAGSDGMYFSALSAGTMEWRLSGTTKTSTNKMTAGSWNHIAVCRDGGTVYISINGITENFGSVTNSSTTGAFRIGADFEGNNFFKGHLSNVRFIKGTALYTSNFIPPTRELKKVPGTVLLCCQDSNDPTQEVTGKTISLNGIYTYDTVVTSGITTAPGPSNFTPQVGDDRKVTFEGVTKINSDAYFYLPTGDTITRDTGSGRGLFGGGDPSRTNSIEYIQIQSTGNGLEFGDLIEARDKVGAGGNRTRGIWAGGDPSSNTISYVTIATRGNAENFGDLSYDGWGTGAAANTTRWLAMGGWSMNHISYVTISSLGDAQDFGDLLSGNYYYKASGSPTRCLMFHRDPGQDISFVTWASTGNATSFGEMTSGTQGQSGTCSDPTRVIRFGGRDSPGGNKINMINYVTISSLGDEQDFGDLTVVSNDGDAVSNSIRGVHHIADSASTTNAVDYVTIQTTGNAQDFGDLTRGRLRFGTASDSQGAIA